MSKTAAALAGRAAVAVDLRRRRPAPARSDRRCRIRWRGSTSRSDRRSVTVLGPRSVIRPILRATAGEEHSRPDVGDQNQRQQHQRSAPGARRSRSGFERLGCGPGSSTGMFGIVPEQVERACWAEDAVDDQQRRGLAGGARDGEDRAGDDPAERRRQDHGDASLRQRSTPSASAASRSAGGTSRSTSWVERAISGSMMIASAIDPANPESVCCGCDDQAEDEQPDTIVGRRPASGRAPRRSARAMPRARAGELGQVDARCRTPIGTAITAASADDHRRADDGGADAAPGPPNCRRILGEEVQAERRGARLDDVEDDDGQHRDGEQRRRDGQPCGDAADDQAPAQVARRRQRRRRVVAEAAQMRAVDVEATGDGPRGRGW